MHVMWQRYSQDAVAHGGLQGPQLGTREGSRKHCISVPRAVGLTDARSRSGCFLSYCCLCWIEKGEALLVCSKFSSHLLATGIQTCHGRNKEFVCLLSCCTDKL
jgi:hypothetical protein